MTPITNTRANQTLEIVFNECRDIRRAGQKEYARREENALANFERIAERTGLSREKVLSVYLEKHIDGIHARIDGHDSQREDVRGRINDVIVYLCLLRAMFDQNEGLDAWFPDDTWTEADEEWKGTSPVTSSLINEAKKFDEMPAEIDRWELRERIMAQAEATA